MYKRYHAHDAVKTSSERSFGFVFAAVFAIVACFPLLSGDAPRWWSAAVAGAFLAAAIAYPPVLALPNRLWARFGLLLHRIVNPIVMGFLFFLVVTPIAMLMRLVGKRPLQTGLDAGAASYWVRREPPGPAPETMKRQF
ncbi:MAG: SxtJ family membrane protein [Alphaproteobacteria bacterium]